MELFHIRKHGKEHNLFFLDPCLDNGGQYIPLNFYGFIIILGIVLGLAGVLFNWFLLKTQDLYSRFKWMPNGFKMMIPFLIAGVLGLFFPQVLGGGVS